jgi:hypothetical protein
MRFGLGVDFQTGTAARFGRFRWLILGWSHNALFCSSLGEGCLRYRRKWREVTDFKPNIVLAKLVNGDRIQSRVWIIDNWATPA